MGTVSPPLGTEPPATLPKPAGLGVGFDAVARGINNAGQVVGGSSSRGASVAITWNGGTPQLLPQVNNAFPDSYAYAINTAGQVAGFSVVANQNIHATVWTGGVPQELGPVLNANEISFAFGLNNNGQVVGSYSPANVNLEHAALWSGGTATDLSSLGGDLSDAFAVNDSGQIVGHSNLTGSNANLHATLWEGTTIFDLNNLLDPSGAGWLLTDALGINDQGQIVGIGIDPNGKSHGFLLTPDVAETPLPATLPLFASGVGVLGLLGWHRKRKVAILAA
jgi:probable HAF family extracellular repeat protein